jgi:uncharacterized membrane protein
MATTDDLTPVPSKAAIFGHPIHPMLIPFPVALLSLVPISDIVYAARDSVFFAQASYYMLWAGLATAALAGVFGLIDFVSIPRARAYKAGWFHLGANAVVVALVLVNALLRVDQRLDAVVPAGLILSLVSAGVLLFSGWYGGELAYRYKIGVMAEGPRPQDRVRPQRHPAAV